MSRVVLVMGKSGEGKSHSIQFLDSTKTNIINILSKDLPWRGSGKQYTVFNKETNKEGNLFNMNNPLAIMEVMKYISNNRPKITSIVIEDHTHIYTNHFLNCSKNEAAQIKAGERGVNVYAKFTDIAIYTKDIVDCAKSLRSDLTVFFIHHIDESENMFDGSGTKAASFGKFVEEKLKGLESLFTIVLLTKKKYNDDGSIYGYFVSEAANASCKAPEGCFPKEIPNNLQLVKNYIDCYYNGDCEDSEEPKIEVKKDKKEQVKN